MHWKFSVLTLRGPPRTSDTSDLSAVFQSLSLHCFRGVILLLWFSTDIAGHSFSFPQPLNVGTQFPCGSVFRPLLLSIATHASSVALSIIYMLITCKFLFYIYLHFQSIFLFPVYTSVLNSRLQYPIACSTSPFASLMALQLLSPKLTF